MNFPRIENVKRMARTVGYLHPLQILGRPHQILLDWLKNVPAGRPPAIRNNWKQPIPEIRDFLTKEATRARLRINNLSDSLLKEYEKNYGFDILTEKRKSWPDPLAIHPYPASVRARNIALGAWLGAGGLDAELARACRAILLRLEFHLLGNHLLENAMALVCAGSVAIGREADLWFIVGSKLLSWQLEEQFLPDGGHFERSASYHLWLTAGLLQTIALAKASGRQVPAQWKQTTRKAVEWARQIRAPDGTYPLFNDAMLDAAPAIDGVVALAQSLGLAESSSHNRPLYHRARIGVRVNPWLVNLPATGWLLLGIGEESWIALDVGPVGSAYQPGHAHADSLTFEMWLHGHRLCVDYGVSSYEKDQARAQTRSTRVHNTVEIDDLDSSETWAAFRVGRRAQAVLLDAHIAKNGEIRVKAQHSGYAWRHGQPLHSREIVLQQHCLHIVDRVWGQAQQMRSRIRMDQEALEAINNQIMVRSKPDNFNTASGLWYPLFGIGQKAKVYEVVVKAPSLLEIHWWLEWQ
jgi:hypothetical protein